MLTNPLFMYEFRSLFPLAPSELGKSTIKEADFPLQPGPTPVDRNPYRANPRVQEVIDMCVNQMEKDPLKKMESSNNDRVNGARQSICCMESYTTTQSPLLLVLSPAGASFLCRSARNLSARASFVSLRRVAAAL